MVYKSDVRRRFEPIKERRITMIYKTKSKCFLNLTGSDGQKYNLRLTKNGKIKWGIYNLDPVSDNQPLNYHHGIIKTRTGLLWYIQSNGDITESTAEEVTAQEALKLLIDNKKEYLLYSKKYNFLKEYTNDPGKYPDYWYKVFPKKELSMLTEVKNKQKKKG
jgi:hypothetical protein